MEGYRAECLHASVALFAGFTAPYPFGLDPARIFAFTETLYRRRLESVLSATLVEA
jgi:hypothetical protein